MKVDLFDPKWDFWAATLKPIETIRRHIRRGSLTDSFFRAA
jgi:hypothetical protein